MGSVLAIDPGRRHGKVLDRLTNELRGHDIVVATSGDEALAVFESQIPELVIFPLFLAPADEARLQSRLRALSVTPGLQSLTLPLQALVDSERHSARTGAVPPRWYYWFKPQEIPGLDLFDPPAFAAAVRAGIDRPVVAAVEPAPATIEIPASAARVAPAMAPPVAEAPRAWVQPPQREPAFEPEPEPEHVPVAWEPAALGLQRTQEPEQHDHRDDALFETFQEAPGPSRAAAALAAVSKVSGGAMRSASRLVSLIGPAAGGLVGQAERVPRAAWVAAIAVVIVGTLGVTGYVTRLIKAPFHWANNTKAEWFPEEPKNGIADIQTVPAGAQVWLSGRQIGVTPFKTDFAVGSYEIELRYRGGTRTVTLDVTPGNTAVQRIEWNAPKITFGKLRVESDPPGAVVSIDGKPAGVTPLTTGDLPVGQHVIDLLASGNTAQETVEVKAGRTTMLRTSVYQGWLALFSPIELKAAVDGRPLALNDSNRALLGAGTHELTIQNRALGYQNTQTVTIAPGQTTAVSVVLPKTNLTITASGPAQVWIDGAHIGDAPIVDVPVEIGTREVMLRSTEHGERRLTVTATVAPVRVAVDLSAPPS